MPLAVGDLAPDFTLKDQNNQDVRLADYQGHKAVLLVFYPLAFTGTCQGEMTEIRDHLPVYENDAVQVMTVSVDSVYSHKVWSLQQGFQFPLLADFWPHGGVASAYDVFDEVTGRANRGTFLINREGTIRFAEMLGPREPRDQKAWQQALEDLSGE